MLVAAYSLVVCMTGVFGVRLRPANRRKRELLVESYTSSKRIGVILGEQQGVLINADVRSYNSVSRTVSDSPSIFRWRSRILMTILLCLFANRSLQAQTPDEIYQRRILPLLESNEKSSCSECHFRGMELREFFGNDSIKTFARLRGLGWIDIENPEDSKLLGFLQKQPDKHSDKLLEKVRKSEYESIRLWIETSLRDKKYRDAEPIVPADLRMSNDLVLHTRRDQVETRFVDAIWSQLGRCVNCHSPERNAKQVAENGEQMSWIVPGDPGATLRLLVDRKIIDIDHPAESLLRTKPLELVEHGGGPKFLIHSSTDQQWMTFLTDFSNTARKDGYKVGDQLPAVEKKKSWLSELQVRVIDLPKEWAGKHMEVRLHRLSKNGVSEEQYVAQGESSINPKGLLWQNALTIYATKPTSLRKGISEWEKPLSVSDTIPNGAYVLRVYLHDSGEASSDKPSQIKRTWVGDLKVNAPWPPGYQPPKILSWKDHVKEGKNSSKN